jgi:hypothetical protein
MKDIQTDLYRKNHGLNRPDKERGNERDTKTGTKIQIRSETKRSLIAAYIAIPVCVT